MRVLILHNDEAYFVSDAIYAFERNLLEDGDECCLRRVKAPLEPQAYQDAEAFDLLVVSGSDYFVSQALARLQNCPTPLCIFPAGMSNLFFESLENPADPASLAKACREKLTCKTDIAEIAWKTELGEIRKSHFSIMSGTGFDAELMRGAIQHKKVMGNASYFFAAINNPHPPKATFEIDIDGTKLTKEGIGCIVANTAMLVGGIEMVYNTSLADGLLDLIVLEVPDALGLIRPFLHGLFDKRGRALGRPTIFHAQGKDIKVKLSNLMPMQIDGEPEAQMVDRFQAHVIEKANTLIVSSFSRYAPKEETKTQD